MPYRTAADDGRFDSSVGETGDGYNTLSLTSYKRAVVTSST